MIEVQSWSVEQFGSLTLEKVVQLHQPAYKFRIHKLRSEPHTPFTGIGVGFKVYVISGSCTIALTWTSPSFTVLAGEFCEVPRGGYVMSFPEPVEYIKVLKLPEEVWPQQPPQSCV